MGTTERILVLGAGKMVEAILTGLSVQMTLENVSIFSPSGTSARRLAEKLGAKFTTDLDSESPELLLIGCKPQQIRELKGIIGNRFDRVPGISMLAALSEKTQREILGLPELVRVMPNLAVSFNEGVILLSSSGSDPVVNRAARLFGFLGHVERVSEGELEDLTLLTGSSPAFFYEFAKHLSSSFSSLDPEKRETLIRKTFAGAAETLRRSSGSLDDLIGSVTSKGGVTIAVLEELRRQDLGSTVKNGITKGHHRARELQGTILQS